MAEGTGHRVPIPILGSSESEIVSYANRRINFYSVYRNAHLQHKAMWLYYYLDKQWLNLAPQSFLTDGVHGFAFQTLDNDDIPKPVTNVISTACDNEIARIGGREYKAIVVATDGSPKIRKAAKLGTDVLNHKLNKQDWPTKRALAVFYQVVCGNVTLRSGWDMLANDQTTIAAPRAVKCDKCNAVLASREIPTGMQGGLLHLGQSQVTDPGDLGVEGRVSLQYCPLCEEQQELRPYEISKTQLNDQDILGRSLGTKVPRGEPIIEVIPPFQYFPAQAGAAWGPIPPRSHASVRVVPIEWVEDRYEQEVIPTPPQKMMRFFPLLCDWDYMSYYDPSYDFDILQDQVLLREICIEPFRETVTTEMLRAAEEMGATLPGPEGTKFFNDGRYYLLAGDTVLEDGPLYQPYQAPDGSQKKLKRVNYASAFYRLRAGEFWADGLPAGGISIQNRINKFDSQFLDTLDRMGNPSIMSPDDIVVGGPEWRQDTGCVIRYFHRSPLLPDSEPKVWQGQLIPAEAWAMRDRLFNNAQDVLNVQDAELGDMPKGVRATSTLFLAGEQAKTRRQPRERSLIDCFEKTFSHQLELLSALRTEDDLYETEARGATAREVHTFKGADLLAQYNVEIDKSASVDKTIYTAEGAKEALQGPVQVYDINDPVARKRYLELANLPEINDKDNCQISNAQDVACDFAEQGITHNPDPSIEDPWIWFEILGLAWIEDEQIQDKKAAIRWNEDVVPKLEGWEQTLQQLETADATARAYYAGTPDPQARYTQETAQYQQAVNTQRAQLQQVAQTGVAPQGLPSAPPQPPPPPAFLPSPDLKSHIMQTWSRVLGIHPDIGATPVSGITPPPEAQNIQLLLDFFATICAYRIYAERKKGAAMSGVPTLAAPGSAATSSGMEAAPTGEPINPAPGTSPNTQGAQMPTGR